MIAALLELHHDVEERVDVAARALAQLFVVLGEHELVVALLNARHLDAQYLLDLGGQRLLDVLLDATQQVRLEFAMQVLEAQTVGEDRRVGAIELLPARESLGHDEVYERPELLERVLQRRAGDEQPMVGVELDERLVEERVFVLEPVRLVDDEGGPRHAVEERLVLEQYLVGGEYDVALDLALLLRRTAGRRVPLVLLDGGARRRVAQVHDHVHLGRPLLELALPALDGRQRYDHQERSVQAVLVEHVRHERDGLDCLAFNTK